ncbi:MAG: heme exporter protein CcmD [Paracoccaceae bacterium]
MPDLGSYALEVSLAYAGSITLLVVLLGVSVAQSKRAKRALDEAESRTKDA